MASVTKRIKQISQPRGGYIKPGEFEKMEFTDNEILKEENIHSSLVGLAVDYLTRFMLGTPSEEAFKISLIGSRIIGEERKAYNMLKSIKGLDKLSIYYACKLVGYDVCFRAGSEAYKKVDDIEPDTDTINNIKVMVSRSILFFNKYGPIIKEGFTFEGGYTNVINSGDGDFLTEDTLWDFKVSKRGPTSAHTLQLLTYYIMGVHSIYDEFKSIKKLGIFNPRINCVYVKSISKIPQEIIDKVSTDVIGYEDNPANYKPQNRHKLMQSVDMIPMAEIMRELSCSRYMVMKFYSQNNLPLVKMKNKYYINKHDLINWREQMEKERKEQAKIVLLIGIIPIVFIMFLLFLQL